MIHDKCCVCRRVVKFEDEWYCECCGRTHHPHCSGEEGGSGGEYPGETEYSICKKCIAKHNKKLLKSMKKGCGKRCFPKSNPDNITCGTEWAGDIHYCPKCMDALSVNSAQEKKE